MSTYESELRASTRAGTLPRTSVFSREDSILDEWAIADLRNVVYRNRVGLIIFDGEFEGYKSALIVADGVEQLKTRVARARDLWNWTVGSKTIEQSERGVRATFSGYRTEVMIECARLEIRFGTSSTSRADVPPPDYGFDSDAELWRKMPTWQSDFVPSRVDYIGGTNA